MWFLPGPIEEEPTVCARAKGRTPRNRSPRQRKEGRGQQCRTAGLCRRPRGALDDRLKCGSEAWLYRLALIEAAGLSCFVGDRIGWRSGSPCAWPVPETTTAAQARVGRAERRLTGGPGRR